MQSNLDTLCCMLRNWFWHAHNPCTTNIFSFTYPKEDYIFDFDVVIKIPLIKDANIFQKLKFRFGFQNALVLVMWHYMLVFLLYYAATLYSLWHLCVTIGHYKKCKLVFIELEKKCYTVHASYIQYFIVLKIDSIVRKKLRQFYSTIFNFLGFFWPCLSVVFFYSIP